jgi:hypothetical protein
VVAPGGPIRGSARRGPTAHALVALALAALLALPGAAAGQNPVFLGLYPWGHDLPETVENIKAFDAWIASTGRRIALAGDFLDIEYAPFLSVPLSMETAWANGRIPFVKLLSRRTALEIANGAIDPAISAWGQSFALWSVGGTKRAFIAPLGEMNGEWTTYYGDAGTVASAYRRIRRLIRAELQAANVPQTAISWVFAPNGWGLSGDEFEFFYPGHDEVDAVGFSSYNWGACPPWHVWETYDQIFEPYLHRMRAMAPGKPIFIAEMAVIDRSRNPLGDRNDWLRRTYSRLAAFPGLRGIMYFERILPTQSNLPGCPEPDFRLHRPGTDDWRGFKDALADPSANFGYWAPTSPEVANVVFAPTVPHVFDDVHPIHPFAREPGDVDYSPAIHTLTASGIAGGCGVDPPRFCPTAAVTRAELAVWLGRAIHGAGYRPRPATGTVFADVGAAGVHAAWIEQLAADGRAPRCRSGRYCPDVPVTRAQMAEFVVRARQRAGYTPPRATGVVFPDVPAANAFAPWIERLAASGVRVGCWGGGFCPDASVSRQEMAAVLVGVFGLRP